MNSVFGKMDWGKEPTFDKEGNLISKGEIWKVPQWIAKYFILFFYFLFFLFFIFYFLFYFFIFYFLFFLFFIFFIFYFLYFLFFIFYFFYFLFLFFIFSHPVLDATAVVELIPCLDIEWEVPIKNYEKDGIQNTVAVYGYFSKNKFK